MVASLKNLTEEDFYKLNLPILFGERITNRRFAILTNGQQTFGLAWGSHLMDPIITEISLNVFGVGIDQYYSIANFTMGGIELTLSLTYNFVCATVISETLFIITEVEIVKVNTITFEVVEEYGLPGPFREMSVKNNMLEIKCTGIDFIVELNAI